MTKHKRKVANVSGTNGPKADPCPLHGGEHQTDGGCNVCDKLDEIFSNFEFNGNVTIDPAALQAAFLAALDASTITPALQAICDKLGIGIPVTVTNTADFQAAFLAALEEANINATITGGMVDVTVTNFADLGAIVQAAIEAALAVIEPLAVEVTNFADIAPFVEAAVMAALESVTVMVEIKNEPLDVNIVGSIPLVVTATIDGEVVVQPGDEWAALLEAAFQAALEAADITVGIDGEPISVTIDPTSGELTINGIVGLDPDSIAALAAAIQAALDGNLEVTIGGQPITITGEVTVTGGNITATIDFSELVDLLDGLNVTLDAAALQAAFEAALNSADDINVIATLAELQQILDAIAASDKDDTDDDVRPQITESKLCILDADGKPVPNTCVYDVIKFDELGEPTAFQNVYLVDGSFTDTLPPETTLGPCPVVETLDPLGPFCDLTEPDTDEDGNPILPTVIQSGVFIKTQICDGVATTSYYTVVDGAETPYEVQGFLGDCDTFAPAPLTKPSGDVQMVRDWCAPTGVAILDNNAGLPDSNFPMYHYGDSIDFSTTLGNGVVVNWSQVPASGWSDQFVRWLDTSDPNSFLSQYAAALGETPVSIGTAEQPAYQVGDCVVQIGCSETGCAGFPGVVAEAADAGVKVAWRHINIVCCGDEFLPVSTEVLATSNTAGNRADVGHVQNNQATVVDIEFSEITVCTSDGTLDSYLVNSCGEIIDPRTIPACDCWEKCKAEITGDNLTIDLSAYEVDPPCATGGSGGGFGDCDCEIAPQQFDPDVGRGRDLITENGDGTYNINGGTTQGIMTMLLHPDSTHPAANCDLVLIHVMQNGASGQPADNTGWLLLHPAQVTNVTGAGYGLGSDITWDPRIAFSSQCRQDDLIDAITAAQGGDGQLGSTRINELFANSVLATSGGGPLRPDSNGWYVNGYAWDDEANAGNGASNPGDEFGRCYRITVDPDCETEETDGRKVLGVSDHCVWEELQKLCAKIDALTTTCPEGSGDSTVTEYALSEGDDTEQAFGIGDVDPDNAGSGIKFDAANDLSASLTAAHTAIRDCIAAGNVANVIITDQDGNTAELNLDYDASQLDEDGNVTQYAYEGEIVDGEPSGGKIRAMTVTCAASAGEDVTVIRTKPLGNDGKVETCNPELDAAWLAWLESPTAQQIVRGYPEVCFKTAGGQFFNGWILASGGGSFTKYLYIDPATNMLADYTGEIETVLAGHCEPKCTEICLTVGEGEFAVSVNAYRWTVGYPPNLCVIADTDASGAVVSGVKNERCDCDNLDCIAAGRVLGELPNNGGPVVQGDLNLQAGDTIDLTDADGNVTGQATVGAATYDAATGQSQVTLQSAQSMTGVKSISKFRKAEGEGEGRK